MANEVYANNEEVACKAADGKSICCFPDVCMTPPENPATPPGVPVPYPNTGLASDTTDGSRTVKISDKEIMLKNKSYFKTSYGDEAGCAAKKGVVTSVNRGKIYFIAWSMDVKVESENVVRHLDMTTHNHASPTTNTAPWTYADRMAMANIKECDEERERVGDICDPWEEKTQCPDFKPTKTSKDARDDAKDAAEGTPEGSSERQAYDESNQVVKVAFDQYADEIESNECHRALRCILSPFKPSKCCKPGQTPHHLVEASSFLLPGVQDEFRGRYYN
jgi:Domain of unknown function (DUF4150)